MAQAVVGAAGHRSVRRSWLIGAVAVLAVGLPGCTSATDPTDPGSTSSPTSTATTGSGSSTTAPATTTSTAAPTTGTAGTGTYPTDVPAAARANTTEGAKEFVKYYLGLANAAYTTPKGGLLPPLSSSTCKTCASFERNANSYVALGYRYDQPAAEVLEVTPAWDDKPGATQRVIDAKLHQNAAKILNLSNGVVKAIDPSDFVMVLTLSWSTSGWMVDLMQVSG